MKLTILQAPYDSGYYGVRMGRGPLHLVEQGLLATLEKAGHDVELISIRLDGFVTEVTSAPKLHRRIAEGVAAGISVTVRPPGAVDVIRATARHLRIAGAGLTSYDPDQDPGESVPPIRRPLVNSRHLPLPLPFGSCLVSDVRARTVPARCGVARPCSRVFGTEIPHQPPIGIKMLEPRTGFSIPGTFVPPENLRFQVVSKAGGQPS